MLDVRNLTKRYGETLALDDLSFQVDQGEVVGFLGPNGAGKTTTIRILTGYIPATRGTVRVAGLDVLRESRKVREGIGYLPENVPIYTDMRVIEYLRFRARLKKVPSREIPSRIEESLDRCGIREVRRKVIANLSRGYRQRVGLADTLVANPPLLILDEPTSGLDPNQRREVKRLLENLRDRHTVFLSSHILAEVESVASRVMILNQGRKVLDYRVPELERHFRESAQIEVSIRAGSQEAASELRGIEGVREVESLGEDQGVARFRISTEAGRDLREQIGAKVSARGWPLLELARRTQTLEELFAGVTIGRGEKLP
ncbi:MAG: ATP-binding cassette domain-containing protein [Planctomycetota bacterium]